MVASSPAAEALTPRSKVAKMLADIDNAPTPSPPSLDRSRDLPARRESEAGASPTVQQTSPLRHNAATQARNTSRSGLASKSEDDDDLDPVRRPQGKAARRMFGAQRRSPESAPFPSEGALSLPSQGTAAQAVDGIDEDEDLYSATPLKARSRGARSASRSPIARGAGGLFVSPAKSQDAGSDEDLPSNPFGSKERLAELVAKKREERLRREEAQLEQQTRHKADEQRPMSPTSRAQKKRRHRTAQSGNVLPTGDASSDLPEDAFEGSHHEVNPDIERIMSDAARPTRKASKKALQEMERETQRLSRQQALAHQMKVKKKFTTSDLMARFGARPQGQPQPSGVSGCNAYSGSSSAPSSDGPDSMAKDPVSTPPSSPPTAGPTPLQKQEAIVGQGALSKLVPVREDSITALTQTDMSDEDLPDIADVLISSRRPAAAHAAVVSPLAATKHGQKTLDQKLSSFTKKSAAFSNHNDSDDDDLEIIAPLPAHLRVFDKVTANPGKKATAETKAIHALRHLSHIGTYEAQPKRGRTQHRPSVGAKTLESQLRRKAKDQAQQQQMERIAELKAKGIEVQTSEEREREAELFENLLEKARLEAQQLRKAEKAASRAAGGDHENSAEVSDDEDEDEDYEGSGSEEDGEEDREDDQEKEDVESDGLVEDAAEVVEDDEMLGEDEFGSPREEDHHDHEIENSALSAPVTRKARNSRIIPDEDDDEDIVDEATATAQPADVSLGNQDPFAAFNFGVDNTSHSLLSPTQAFQATMQTPSQATQEDSFDILRRIAPSSAFQRPSTFHNDHDMGTRLAGRRGSQVSMVPGSQVPESQRIDLAWETQAPETPVPATLNRGASILSETPGWEPTQDPGLPSPWTISVGRRETIDATTEEHETQETVRLRISESPAPAAAPARKGRLIRRQVAGLADSSDDEEAPTLLPKVTKTDAFGEMARRRAAALSAEERAEVEKEMKQMMEEQAEESEDEYAGLGGDDFVAPETEEDKAMIDSSHVEIDERGLAAHYAERERQRHEDETNRLYKDLTTGALRRKQANTWGLEEDEDEIAMRRRQMKQREEARKRKLLLQDDNIAGLAHGKQTKGKDAFLKAIADDDDGEDLLDLSDAEDESQQVSTQEETLRSQHDMQIEPLREVSGNKRQLTEEGGNDADRPPAKQRRTHASAFKKPTSLLEVRESLSFLLEEPDAQLAAPSAADLEADSDDEYGSAPEEDGLLEADDDEEEAEQSRQNDGGFAPNPADFDARAMPPPRLPASHRRTAATKSAVVDRLDLKRGNSASATTGALSRTAWASPAAGGFKTPSLLRRATTNMTSAANGRGVTTSNGLSRENSGSGVKMGGSKKSSLAYQARAEERKAIVEASAKRREENTARIAQMRRNSSALGKGLTGRFE